MLLPHKTKKKGVLSVIIKDKADLSSSYMPFILNGGLLIQTGDEYMMGQEVLILLALLGDPERLSTAGKVIWIAPPGHSNHGIGVQFDLKNEDVIRRKIEAYLGLTSK